MTPQVITVSRQKYAVGLFWQLKSPGFDVRDVAKSLDKKFNLYTEYLGMVGLGEKVLGHRARMRVAAPEVMEFLSEYTSFAATFYVGGFYWIMSVRNGIILSDELFDTEAAAKTEFTKLTQIPDWGALFAPAAWGIPRATDRGIDDVISGRGIATLHPINRFRINLLTILICVLILFGIAYLFRNQIMTMFRGEQNVVRIDPNLAAEYKKKIEEQRAAREAVAHVAVVQPVVMPYDTLPDMLARADICYRAMDFLMQPIAGWIQTSVECGETHAFATFRRDFGSVGGFYEIATELMPGAYVVQNSDSEILVRAMLPGLPTFSSLEEKDPETIARQVATIFQQMDAPVEINTVIRIVGDDVAAVNINVVEVGASSKLIPMEFMKIFAEFSGVHMTKVSWDARSKTWNYEVIIYGK